MAERHVIGTIAVAIGLFFALARRPLAELQVRTQPRFVRSWRHAVPASRAVFLLIGIGLIVFGVFTIVDLARWLSR